MVLEAVEKNQVLPHALNLARTIALNSPSAVRLLVRTLRYDDDVRTFSLLLPFVHVHSASHVCDRVLTQWPRCRVGAGAAARG